MDTLLLSFHTIYFSFELLLERLYPRNVQVLKGRSKYSRPLIGHTPGPDLQNLSVSLKLNFDENLYNRVAYGLAGIRRSPYCVANSPYEFYRLRHLAKSHSLVNFEKLFININCLSVQLLHLGPRQPRPLDIVFETGTYLRAVFGK